MASKTDVYLEIGAKRTFAGAVDWPGWCRSGKNEAAALEALTAYGGRYADVIGSAGLDFQAPDGVTEVTVVERLTGNATTDFGAPAIAPRSDHAALGPTDVRRLSAILEASWRAFDERVASAAGRRLSVGPRGGGRSLDKIVEHVVGAEEGYLRQLGRRPPKGRRAGDGQAVVRLRELIVESLAAIAAGDEIADATAVRSPWSARYFARRATWHVLDHAWEIQDRDVTPQ
jgi:hypothetical protein